MDIKSRFNVLGKKHPWLSKFTIDGVTYGSGRDHSTHDVRIKDFYDRLGFAPKRIMELGACNGGGTVELAKNEQVEEVLAIEGRDYNVEKISLVASLFNPKKIKIYQDNLETCDLSSFGKFDAIYCVGLLYHMPRPWELIKNMTQVSDVIYINTHYCTQQEAAKFDRYYGKLYAEHGANDPLSGLSAHSFWPTLDSLQLMFDEEGFSCEFIDTHTRGEGQSPDGVTLIARRVGDKKTTIIEDEDVKLFSAMCSGSVLEIGNLSKNHTVHLAKRYNKITCIDWNDEAIAKTKVALAINNINHVEIRKDNIEEIELEEYGQVDSIFCVGVLEQLQKPWLLLKQLHKAGEQLFIKTSYSVNHNETKEVYRGHTQNNEVNPFAMSKKSFWLAKADLFNLLKFYYFHVGELFDDTLTNTTTVLCSKRRSGTFNESSYLQHNDDVRQAVSKGAFRSGWHHFLIFGQYENRHQ